MGRSPDLVEDQITYPIVTALRAAPGVQYVRGLSMLGDSFVYVVFKEGVDLYWARSRVLEYLAAIRGKLPEGVNPTLGPDATAVGWVFEYALVDTTGRHDLSQLRSFQDWTLRYWLQSVDGVAEVASVGGFVRQYQVDLDPDRLLAYNVPIASVVEAIRRSNKEVGGGVIEVAEHENAVRGRGYVRSIADLESVPVRVSATGVPVTLRDLGEVHLGPEQRRGLAELNGEGEVVGGIVIMRQRQNALRVIDGIALAIGAMVDASIIRVENVHKKLEGGAVGGGQGSRDATIIHALQEVGRPIFFALLVITVSFLPIFTLEATEGRLFKPLAFTKTYSMGFAALLAVTLTPALAAWFIRGRIRAEREHPLSHALISAYAPVVRFAVRRKRWV